MLAVWTGRAGRPIWVAQRPRLCERAAITLQALFAATTPEPVSFPTRELFGRAPGASLYGLYIFAELDRTGSGSADLRRLADLIEAGRLDPQIDIVRSWADANEAIEALLQRRVSGKVVLTVD